MSETPTDAIETMMEPVAPEAPFWTKLENLPAMVKALAEARQKECYRASAVRGQEQVLSETQEWRFLEAAKTDLAVSRLEVAALDAAVRDEALKDFKDSGKTKVNPGVEVKLHTLFVYDHAQMTAWAHVHKPALLSLDTKAVHKEAETLITRANAPITISKEPKVYIDSDLSSYLGEVKE
jgi:hypothetical protein